MAMNKTEQATYNRALETGKKYEQMYRDLHNKLQDFMSYLSVRKTMLELNNDVSIVKSTEIEICKELLEYIKKGG